MGILTDLPDHSQGHLSPDICQGIKTPVGPAGCPHLFHKGTQLSVHYLVQSTGPFVEKTDCGIRGSVTVSSVHLLVGGLVVVTGKGTLSGTNIMDSKSLLGNDNTVPRVNMPSLNKKPHLASLMSYPRNETTS
eukprot:sb/3474913/